MSVIVRTPENKILIVCKGADNVIIDRLYPGQDLVAPTNKYLDEFAKTGLRTLLIATRELDAKFYDQW
jgi:magnesium-transporting ATPase (P-type)